MDPGTEYAARVLANAYRAATKAADLRMLGDALRANDVALFIHWQGGTCPIVRR